MCSRFRSSSSLNCRGNPLIGCLSPECLMVKVIVVIVVVIIGVGRCIFISPRSKAENRIMWEIMSLEMTTC